MMGIDTSFLERHLGTMESALGGLGQSDCADKSRGLYRAVCFREFEIVMEQSRKLLSKLVGRYFADNRQADRLTFRNLFRQSAKHDLLDISAVERWLRYHDNLNDGNHDDDPAYAETTVKLLPGLVEDARVLVGLVKEAGDE